MPCGFIMSATEVDYNIMNADNENNWHKNIIMALHDYAGISPSSGLLQLHIKSRCIRSNSCMLQIKLVGQS